MKVYLEIDEHKLRELVFEYVCNVLNVDTLKTGDVKIEVKSNQNYKSEWESAKFRAVVDKNIP